MKFAQPHEIVINQQSESRYLIDIPKLPEVAQIEKRGSYWFLELLPPSSDTTPDIVTNYFNGRAPAGISLESYISGWLMNLSIFIPE